MAHIDPIIDRQAQQPAFVPPDFFPTKAAPSIMGIEHKPEKILDDPEHKLGRHDMAFHRARTSLSQKNGR